MRIHAKDVVVACSAVAVVAGALLIVRAQGTEGSQGTENQQGMQQGGAPAPAHTGKIDINTATKEELQTLPGVDDATARKIIDNRPYKNAYQLVKKDVVSKAEYKSIKKQIVAKRMKHKGAMGGEEPKQQQPQQTP